MQASEVLLILYKLNLQQQQRTSDKTGQVTWNSNVSREAAKPWKVLDLTDFNGWIFVTVQMPVKKSLHVPIMSQAVKYEAVVIQEKTSKRQMSFAGIRTESQTLQQPLMEQLYGSSSNSNFQYIRKNLSLEHIRQSRSWLQRNKMTHRACSSAASRVQKFDLKRIISARASNHTGSELC